MQSPSITYSDVEKKLLSMPRFQDVGGRAAHFGIDQISEFCEVIGNPQNSYRVIHVAGTNGKGTVCSIIASLLKEAGYKTGLYTSPHLKDVRERFRVDGKLISETQVVECYYQFEPVLSQFPLTFFELTTAMAFKLFEMEQVDFAVIETGLGGRLDATNIVNPEGCAITSIGFDHMEQLGDTIEAIAYEKAGILKRGIPFTLGNIAGCAREVILERANQIGARLIENRVTTRMLDNGNLEIAIDETQFQSNCDINTPRIEENVRVSLELLVKVLQNEHFPTEFISEGLKNIRVNSGLSGRFEKLVPDKDWYFDGGHNQEAMSQVIAHLNHLFPGRSKYAIISLMSDKLSPELIELLNQFNGVYFFEIQTPRALKASNFIKSCTKAKIIASNVADIKKNLIDLKSELVLFTGSFYFYTTVTEWMESISLDSN